MALYRIVYCLLANSSELIEQVVEDVLISSTCMFSDGQADINLQPKQSLRVVKQLFFVILCSYIGKRILEDFST